MKNFSRKMYSILITLYPSKFREEHGRELRQMFDDMLADYGSWRTWARVLPDFISSSIIINSQTIMQQSPVQIKLALWGIVLLAPLGAFIMAGVVGSLFHFPVNEVIGGQIAQHVAFATFILIGFPALAFLLNLFPLASSLFRQNRISDVVSLEFVRMNFLSLMVAAAGIGAIVLVLGHDSIPCFAHGLINQGFHNVKPLFDVCKNA